MESEREGRRGGERVGGGRGGEGEGRGRGKGEGEGRVCIRLLTNGTPLHPNSLPQPTGTHCVHLHTYVRT